MAKKVERKLSRLEMADYLASLGQQLRNGKIEVEGRTWPVPEALETRFHLKEEEGAIVAKLSWRWSARENFIPVTKPTDLPRSAAWKTVKAELASSFKEVQRVLGQGLFPDEKVLRDFVASSRTFAKFVKPEWQEPLAQFMAHLENFQRAGANRQLAALQQELQELAHRMAACHREFK
jgi:XXXCH domain-containing protein